MKRINTHAIFPLLALFILILALSQQMFSVFPIGKVLNPFSGAVQNEDDRALDATALSLGNMGLSGQVDVYFDKRKVPHIFASSTDDLFFAQGYVTAALRLWQMDFLSYASAGRLSEIFKDGYVNYDRNQRRIGMLSAAKSSLALIEKDPETFRVVSAYTKGVNAYIKKLNYRTRPFEYKLLDYDPEPWTNLKTVLLMKYVANMLSGYEEDFNMSNLMLTLGEEKFNKLFPDYTDHTAPMMPAHRQLALQQAPHIRQPAYLDYSFFSSGTVVPKSDYNPQYGSNTWAVSGKKTKSGYPILCSDPHLALTLPSIWVEMQLSAPGINAYGISIPGTPALLIGFNQNVAWGISNGADDVKDWYKLKVTDDYTKYELDGKWQDLHYAIEEIKRRGEQTVKDTIYQTVFGPVVSDKHFSEWQPDRVNYALKWELHHPSNEFRTFIKLIRATNYTDYKEAISQYSCPSLNFVFASKDNDIAANHQGKLLIKQPGEGRFIYDANTVSELTAKYIPADSLPGVLNPACNFVFSANQRPASPDYPYYYNGYYRENRAQRIRDLLERDSAFDVKKMEAMQLDNTNNFALQALPIILAKLDKNKLSSDQQQLLSRLSTWKGTYNLDDVNARLFERWWKNIRDYTWDELKGYTFSTRVPDDYILMDLIEKEPDAVYFDKQGTSARENAGEIINAAFVAAVKEYKESPARWGDVNKVNVMHMTKLPAFSRPDLPSAGFPEAINAVSANWGPSWRMIVELGPKPVAYGIFAGGQSGSLGSRHYDDFVDDWNKGQYYPITFLLSAAEGKQVQSAYWKLK